MKLRTPEYYKYFHCSADKCSDCCCIGWEIDIDNKTADFYKKINGNFGNKLRKNINFDKTNNFILDKNDRCPFLNNKNLCEIFTELGEKSLCNICTNHPRYYEWFNELKEGGIGLCCEEAAKLIISQNTKFKTFEIDIPYEKCHKYDKNLFDYLTTARNSIISYLDDTTFSLNSRIRDILWYAYTIQQNIDSELFDDTDIFPITSYTKCNISNIFNIFLKLDPFAANWIPYLQNCRNIYNKNLDKYNEFEDANPNISIYLKNISIYFIWRYFMKGVFNYDIISKVQLMAVSVLTIKLLFFCKWIENGKITFDDCVEISKNFSKEIEYSEDNLIKLEDFFYTDNNFSIENLIGLWG